MKDAYLRAYKKLILDLRKRRLTEAQYNYDLAILSSLLPPVRTMPSIRSALCLLDALRPTPYNFHF